MSRGGAVAIRAAVTTVSALAAVVAVLGDAGAPVRPMLVIWFVLVCPGMAFVGLIRLPSPLFALTLSIALSCALAVVVAQAMLFAGVWNPVAGLVTLAVLTMVGTGTDVWVDRRARRLTVHTGQA